MVTKPETVRIRGEFGAHLIGRDVGKRIRERYFAGSPDTWPRALDFTEVEQVTESCADELFGTLGRRAGVGPIRSIQLLDCTPSVREAIEYIIALVEQPLPLPSQESIKRILRRGNGRRTAR